MTQKQIDKLLKKWQKILLLQDWDILVKFHHFDVMGCNQGFCKPHPDDRSAEIALVHPNDYDPSDRAPWPYDIEATLVHELLHIHLHFMFPYEDQGLERELAEGTIASLERAFITLDRRC